MMTDAEHSNARYVKKRFIRASYLQYHVGCHAEEVGLPYCVSHAPMRLNTLAISRFTRELLMERGLISAIYVKKAFPIFHPE